MFIVVAAGLASSSQFSGTPLKLEEKMFEINIIG